MSAVENMSAQQQMEKAIADAQANMLILQQNLQTQIRLDAEKVAATKRETAVNADLDAFFTLKKPDQKVKLLEILGNLYDLKLAPPPPPDAPKKATQRAPRGKKAPTGPKCKARIWGSQKTFYRCGTASTCDGWCNKHYGFLVNGQSIMGVFGSALPETWGSYGCDFLNLPNDQSYTKKHPAGKVDCPATLLEMGVVAPTTTDPVAPATTDPVVETLGV